MLRRLSSLLLLCVPLAACQTPQGKAGEVDPYAQSYLQETLKPGITTREDVRLLFGAPDSVQNGSSGPWLWVYYADIGRTNVFSYALRNLGLGSLLGTPSGPGLSPSLFVRFEGNTLAQYILEPGRSQSSQPNLAPSRQPTEPQSPPNLSTEAPTAAATALTTPETITLTQDSQPQPVELPPLKTGS